jgi:hypothetical protein
MKNKKKLILRTIPLSKFQCFIKEISLQQDLENCDILIQKDCIDSIEFPDIKVNFILIEPGPFNFFKGLKYFSFLKYDKIIVPVNNYDLEHYSNLLFFILPILSKEYLIFYPDLSFEKYSYLSVLFITIVIEIISWIALLFILPFYLLGILYFFLKNKLFS